MRVRRCLEIEIAHSRAASVLSTLPLKGPEGEGDSASGAFGAINPP
jgi:hypothetical protein